MVVDNAYFTASLMTNDVRALFNRIAPVYDQFNDWLSLGQHRIWKEMTIKWSNATRGDTCLDLCCGSGDLALRLSRRIGSESQVYGVDFSSGLLEIASQRAQNCYPTPNITWVEADVLDLPFDGDRFDAVTMGYGLRNVTDISRSLEEIHRVLKKGGIAAILDFHRPQNASSRYFQEFYLQNIVVPLASYMGLKEEYAYISPSLDRFPTGDQQVKLSYQAGFACATHYPIANGMMGVLVITKAG